LFNNTGKIKQLRMRVSQETGLKQRNLRVPDRIVSEGGWSCVV